MTKPTTVNGLTQMPTSLSTLRFRHIILAVLLGLALASISSAQEASGSNQPSERTSSDLQKLQPLVDAKNWNGAINLMQGILRYAAPNSYDQALANDILSKIYLQEGEYAKVIEPMEKAYILGENYKFFDAKSQLERLYYLAQIYYQEGASSKTPSLQKNYFDKATNYIEIWLKGQNSPNAEGQMFYVQLLYNRAVQDPQNIDMELLKKAQAAAQEALQSELFPKETFYVILLASYQQEGKLAQVAELLELLVKQYPSKSSYWMQLFGTYSNLAAEASNPDEVYDYNLRAIVTIERAQALGFMNTPKDNYNLVGIYFNIGQYGKATDLLHSGLRSGAIEADIKKWELLAYSFLQINQEFKAIEVLKEATKAFPKSGQLDNQIAQIYYSLNNSEEAYRYLNSALAKGGLDKPGAVYYFKAYICYELQKYEEALESINTAADLQDEEDPQLPRLRQAIQEAIKDRQAALEAGVKE